MVAIRGKGKEHAKWSPVCSAYYRLVPSVSVKKIDGERAVMLKELCPMGVFDIEDTGKVIVKNARKCTMCRECIRVEEFRGDVELSKLENHYECKFC